MGLLDRVQPCARDWSVTQFLSDTGHRDAIEVVSLVSDSLETIKKTHSRYFADRELVVS